MDDLISFLLARLAEDQATASCAGPARIAWLTYLDDNGQMLYTTVAAGEDHAPWVADGHELPEPTSARIVYDPARALREVAAKREIVGGEDDGLALYVVHERGVWPDELTRAAKQILRRMAAVYSGHPDYQPEWAA